MMMEMKRKQILVGWLGNVHVILRRLSRRRVKMLDLCQKAFPKKILTNLEVSRMFITGKMK